MQVVGHPTPSAGRDLSLLLSLILPFFWLPIDFLKSLAEDPFERIDSQRNLMLVF